jgi:hypothetical protein
MQKKVNKERFKSKHIQGKGIEGKLIKRKMK